jgi:nucleotide-binding universal stress UspA family protein
MKTILCPVDSNPITGNAAKYAESLAQQMHAHMLLLQQPSALHAYNPFQPANAPEIPGRGLIATDIERLASNVQTEAEVVVQSEQAQLQAMKELNQVVQSEKADLLVLGIDCKHRFSELTGGPLANLVANTQRPVLIVPEKVRFKPLKQIVVIVDRECSLTHRINLIAEFAAPFKAEIAFLQIGKNTDAMSAEYINYNNLLEIYFTFNYPNVSFHTLNDPNTEEAIRFFVKKVQADMLVIMPDSHTRQCTMAEYYTAANELSVPVLAIDEQPVFDTSTQFQEYMV